MSWEALRDNVGWFDRYRSHELVAWIPDGSGYLVRAPAGPLDMRVHRVRGPGSSPELLAQLPRNASTFYGHPSRDYLVTYTDVGGDEQYRLHRWDLGSASLMAITPPGERAIFGAFEPDGPRIAYTSNRRNGRDFDVYVVDPLDVNTDRRLIELEGSWTVAGWSPDGRRLLLSRSAANTLNDLFLLNVATRTMEAAAPSGGHYKDPGFSRDGRYLVYATDRQSEFSHLYRRDLVSGLEEILTPTVPWDVASIQEARDGRLLIRVNEGGVGAYYFLSPDDPSFLDPFDPVGTGLLEATLHPAGGSVILQHSDERGTQRVYLFDLETEELEHLSGPPPRQSGLPAPLLIEYPTFDRDAAGTRKIPAFVYPGAGEGPHPVVISIHGGPEAQAPLTYGWGAIQRRGITVITPNVRGSTGYGRTYEGLDDGVLREDAVRDIGALLDWIVEQPDLDPDRVAVVGGSYGGYMVLASLVHFSDRLSCGIDRVGISNFVTFLENTAEYRKDLRRAEYGDERQPEMREFLEAISPLNNAHRITAPLMVVQGARDPRVPVSEALQLVERVRQNQRSVPYIEAADEGHGFKKPWNAAFAHLAEQDLLRECLGR